MSDTASTPDPRPTGGPEAGASPSPDPAHTGRTIDTEVTAATTPDRAWEAWADPEKLAGWFVDRAVGSGRSPGDVMTWFFDRFGFEVPYRVVASVPGERIAFGPGSDDMPPFLLEVLLTRDGGDTRIRLINSGFSEDADFDEQFAGTASGWRMALGVLKEYLEHHFGQPKATFMAMRPAPGSPDDARPWFVEPERLGRWFATAEGDGDGPDRPDGSGPSRLDQPDASVRLALVDDAAPATLTGRVLAATAREVALSWKEIDGVCELKAFSQGGQPMLCIRGFGWGMDDARAAELEARMGVSLERLAEAMAEG